MPDGLYTMLAQAMEGAAHTAGERVGFWLALGFTVVGALGLVVARVFAVAIPKLDPYISRYWALLLLFAAMGFTGLYMGQLLLVATVAAAAGVVIWRLERRRSRNPQEKKKQQRRAQIRNAAIAVAVVLAVGVLNAGLERWQRRNTRFCLLLSFDYTSKRDDNIVAAWVQFGRTWRDVFSDVEGVNITPPSATDKDFDKFANEAHVRAYIRSIKPDIVLKTLVNIPEKSILLVSHVCTIDLKETDVTFSWRGSIDALQHTALLGAADLLRHLHTLKDRPLSDEQHAQAARNLLRRYSDFLSVQTAGVTRETLDAVQREVKTTTPIGDDRIAELLGGFDPSAALEEDARKDAAARDAALSKLGIAR